MAAYGGVYLLCAGAPGPVCPAAGIEPSFFLRVALWAACIPETYAAEGGVWSLRYVPGDLEDKQLEAVEKAG